MARNDKSSDEQQKRGRSPGIRRMIAAAAFMPMAGRAPLYARLIWSLIQDERVPMTRKALLGGALGYVVLGRDVVPDRVPLLGQLDDLVIVALAIDLFVDGLDDVLLAEKLAEAGIPRVAYDEDVARVRRLVPGPIRRVARRVPEGIRLIAQTVDNTGLPDQLRRWINDARGGGSDDARSGIVEIRSTNGRRHTDKQLVEGSIA